MGETATPDEVRRVRILESQQHGHDFDIIQVFQSNDPIRVLCGRCGETWAIGTGVTEAVAKTLRYFGARNVPLTPSEMLEMAEAVEAYDPAADDLSTACCPVCEEMECDDDCPLAGVRA